MKKATPLTMRTHTLLPLEAPFAAYLRASSDHEEHLSRHETPQSRKRALRLAEEDTAGEDQAAPPQQAAKEPRRGRGKKA
jgi:hypothetical protein